MIDFFEDYPFIEVGWAWNGVITAASVPGVRNGIYYGKDNWDDFGHKTTYQLVARIDGEIIDLGNVKISTLPYQNLTLNLQDIVQGRIDQEFISLGNVEYYNFINTYLNSAEKALYYKRLGDIAYDIERLSRLYTDENTSSVIQSSLLRDYRYSEVENELHRLAHGGNYQEKYNIKIIGSENYPLNLNITVDPSDDFPDTLYAIVGNNGSGKTFFIRNLTKLFLQKVSEGIESDNIFSIESTLEEFESLLVVSYSPFDCDLLESSGRYKFIGLNYDLEMPLNEYIINEITERLILAGQRHHEKLSKIIEKLSFDPLFVSLKERNLEVQTSDSKEEVKEKISSLSSGQKIILLNLLTLILEVSEKTFVIIDEPELFLHPPLLKGYIRAVEEIVKEGNGACLLATHSSIVLQEIPHTNVRKLKFDPFTNSYTTEPLNIRTFGESVSFINDTIYGTDLRNTGFYDFLSEKLLKSEELSSKLENVLGSEARLIRHIQVGDSDEKNL